MSARPNRPGWCRIVVFCPIAALAFTPMAAASANDLFAGKTVRLVVPGSAAGGYSLYGQLAANHLGRFIPGNPAIVMSYMPGAAGLGAMNYLYEVAPRDGTVIAILDQDVAAKQALGLEGVRYDSSKFNYLGRATANVPVHMVWHTAAAKTIRDLKRHEVITGAVGNSGTHIDLPRAQNVLIGTKWKIISGYPGTNETRIAMERGETQAAIGPATLFNSQLKPWLEQGTVRVVVQYADFRHPGLPGVPTIVELAEGAEANVFKFLVSAATLGRAYAAPPGVPPEHVEILRKAVKDMLQDPKFKADAEKRGADLLPMSGEDLAAYIREIADTQVNVINRTKEVIGTK